MGSAVYLCCVWPALVDVILDMWLLTQHMSALLAKKSDNIIKVSPILLPLQTLHIKSTSM